MGPQPHRKLLVSLDDDIEHCSGASYLDLSGGTADARTDSMSARGWRRTESLEEFTAMAGAEFQVCDHHTRR